jgi:hypothetical protein
MRAGLGLVDAPSQVAVGEWMRRPIDPDRGPGSADREAMRSWYEDVQRQIRADPDLAPGDVVASWSRMARPMAVLVSEPTKQERRSHPGRYVRADDGGWLALMTDGSHATDYDGPLETKMVRFMSIDRTGAYVQTGGRTVRDRERALDVSDVDGWARELIADLLPSGRSLGARKGAHPDVVARALVLWSLKSHLGLRPAARRVIIWDAELDTTFADTEQADLMRRYEEGESLTEDERRRRDRLESTVIKTSGRIWKSIGLRPAISLRI